MNLMQMSMTAGALILGIILFRSLFVHRLPKKIMVILWEIAILRLLFPFSIPLPLPEPLGDFRSLITTEQAYDVRTEIFDENWIGIEISENSATALAETAQPEQAAIIFIVYLAGAVIMLSVSFFLYARDSQLFREGLLMAEGEKKKLLALAGMGEKDLKRFRKVKFQISDRTVTPVTYGVIRSAVVFPKEMYLREDKEVSLCLQHELVHIRNHDNLKKLIAHTALCIHWFNPLVWVMYLLFNRDMELLCDETVVRHSGESRKDYALTLLSLAECRSRDFQTGLGFGKNAVKERIVAVMTFKKTTLIGVLTAIIAVTGALTVFVTNSVNHAQNRAEITIEAAAVTEYAYSASEATVTEFENLPESMRETIEGLAAEFKEYGLSAEFSEDDYQLYYEGEPIYFFADNKKQIEEGFSGRLFVRPADHESGYTGVITEYDGDGNITGLVHLSKEESSVYSGSWTGDKTAFLCE